MKQLIRGWSGRSLVCCSLITIAWILYRNPPSPAQWCWYVLVSLLWTSVILPWHCWYARLAKERFARSHWESLTKCLSRPRRPEDRDVVDQAIERLDFMLTRSKTFRTRLTWHPSATGLEAVGPSRFYLRLFLPCTGCTSFEKLVHEVEHHCDALERLRRTDGLLDAFLWEYLGTLPEDLEQEIENDVVARTPSKGWRRLVQSANHWLRRKLGYRGALSLTIGLVLLSAAIVGFLRF
jgi:hypothetical protein